MTDSRGLWKLRTKGRNKPGDITEAIMVPIAVAGIPRLIWIQSPRDAAVVVTLSNDGAGKHPGAFIN